MLLQIWIFLLRSRTWFGKGSSQYDMELLVAWHGTLTYHFCKERCMWMTTGIGLLLVGTSLVDKKHKICVISPTCTGFYYAGPLSALCVKTESITNLKLAKSISDLCVIFSFFGFM